MLPDTLGYKKYALTDQDGYIEQLHFSSANEHESQHLEALPENLNAGTTVYAGKGYSSQANRQRLREKGLKDDIMEKASRSQSLSQAQKARNKLLSKMRYVIERVFGVLYRKFSGKCAS
ncbi:Transposase DDE domain [Suttonella ornithocola]|uniref:Transposase DDE domain n=1 Tax=Suttonella ornithocola TaxID=279832 RepID=A0A380MRT6_9GAMM|nr:Transposase DDE domain [Suttonella ornithocola]